MNKNDANVRVFDFFKVGRHVAMNGLALEFSENDLDRICNNYRFQNPAPLVIGHPVNDAPAVGSVEEVFHKGGSLYAVASCSESLLGWVRSGRFKNRSAKFARTPSLPGYSLQHIGFLGAAAPAVSGLSTLSFGSCEQENEALCFSGSVWDEEESGQGGICFSAPPGYQVDPTSAARYSRASQLRASCPALSFVEAVSIADRLFQPIRRNHGI